MFNNDYSSKAKWYNYIRIIWDYPRYWKSILAYPYAEPLHDHHDGCPACWF